MSPPARGAPSCRSRAQPARAGYCTPMAGYGGRRQRRSDAELPSSRAPGVDVDAEPARPRRASCPMRAAWRRGRGSVVHRPPSSSTRGGASGPRERRRAVPRCAGCRRCAAAWSSVTSRPRGRRSCWCTAWSTTGPSSPCCGAACAGAVSGRSAPSTTARFTSDVRLAARNLAEHVEALCSDSGYERIHVIGHSMGGLIARYYVQRLDGDERVHTLVTLGTPHGGSAVARWVPHALARQLRPGSDLLAELDAPAPDCRTRFVTVWSDQDQMILPARHGKLHHADLTSRNVLVSGVGHMSLPIDGRSLTRSPRRSRSSTRTDGA